jgi:hypothetical protein
MRSSQNAGSHVLYEYVEDGEFTNIYKDVSTQLLNMELKRLG